MKLKTLICAGRLAAIALTGLVVISCKKDNPKPEPEPEPVVTERTEAQLIKDDIYKYYKLYSLWETSIPDYKADPSKFTDQYSSAGQVLSALKKMTPSYPKYKEGVIDRFSYFVGANGYNISSFASNKIKMDTYNGYGFEMFNVHFGTSDNKTVQPIIDFVEGGSPAYLAGFRRSDIVTAINNDNKFSVGIDDSEAKTDMLNRLSSALSSPKFTLEVIRNDGSVLKRELTYGEYVIDPVYKESIFNFSNNNIGYLALSSFEEIEEETTGGKINKKNIDAVFKKFQDQNIKSLIVDLRYNGGGYVDAAVYIADKIGGSKLKSKLMLTYETNKYLQSDATSSLRKELNIRDTYFQGLSTLNLDKVYFLVSEHTASAAEMLINVIRPHNIAVKIIASGTHTFGKPVGFFRQLIQNKVYFWPVSFKLRNKDGVSDYWDGLLADEQNIIDYVFADLGDPEENMLEAAFNDAVPNRQSKASSRKKTSFKYSLPIGKVYSRPEIGMFKK